VRQLQTDDSATAAALCRFGSNRLSRSALPSRTQIPMQLKNIIRICLICFAIPLIGLCVTAGEPPNNPGSKWSAEQYARKTIYHSVQKPGYTCWLGAWQMPPMNRLDLLGVFLAKKDRIGKSVQPYQTLGRLKIERFLEDRRSEDQSFRQQQLLAYSARRLWRIAPWETVSRICEFNDRNHISRL